MKRLLSLLLTVCMLISLLPAVSIAHAAEKSGITVVYPFSTELAYSTGVSTPADIKYTSVKSGGRVEWYLCNQRFPASYGSYALGIYTMSDEEYASYKIKVPAAGTYTVRQKFAYRVAGTESNMYILPAGTTDIAGAIKSATPVLTVNSYSATVTTPGSEIRSESAPEVTAEWTAPAAGEYIVAWQGTGEYRNPEGRWYVALGDLILDGGDAVVPIYSESLLSKTKLNIKLGNSAEISTSKVVKSDGSAGNANDIAALTYKSSDENVTAVDGKKITAVGVGSAKIYTMSGDFIIEENELTVVDEALNWSGATVIYPFESKDYPECNNAEEINYINSGCRVEFSDKEVGAKPILTNLAWYRYALSIHIRKNEYYAYKINIPQKGYYNVNVGYQKAESGTLASLYVLPADTADILAAAADAEPVMTVDFNGEQLPQQEEAPFFAEGLYEAKETGDHILVWIGTGNTNSMGRYVLQPRDIIFNGGSDIVPMGLNFKLSKALRPSVSLAMSDGSAIDAEKLGIEYSFSPEGIVTQNPASGKFETPGTGDVTVTASVEYGGKTYSATVKRTITGEEILPYSGAYAKYDFSQKSPFWQPVYWQGTSAPKTNDIRGITYEYTANTGVGNWQWHESSIPNIYTQTGNTAVQTYVATNIDGYMQVGISKGKWVAFKIKVPAAGRYLATAAYRTNRSGRVAAGMYILPGDVEGVENIEALLVEDNYIGMFDCNDPDELSASLYTAQYPDVDIPENMLSADGEAVLVFKALGGGYFEVKSVSIDGTPGLKSAELAFSNDTVEVGQSKKLDLKAKLLDESVIDLNDLDVKYTSKASNIAEVSKDGTVTGISAGTAEITARVTYNGAKVTAVATVYVEDTSEKISGEISVDKVISESARRRVILNVKTKNGSVIEISPDELEYSLVCEPDGIAYVDEDGYLNAIAAGNVTLSVALKENPEICDQTEIEIILNEGKSEVTLFTEKMRENALLNAKKYDWAKDAQKLSIERADEYVENMDFYYDHIIGEGLPRAYKMGTYNNPDYKYCNYCGVDIVSQYGNDGTYAYNISFMARPWKIQCPDCKRLFPSNDFGSFYELGLDEHGLFNIKLARKNHHKMLFHADGEECTCTAPTDQNTAEWHEYYGYGNPDGYLYNELYSEVRDSDTDPNPQKSGRYVNGDIWGVDDGFGYIPRDEEWKQYTHAGGIKEMHTPIAYFNALTWFQNIRTAIVRLTNAYLYTGEARYGRTGAILLDRIADVYQEMDLFKYFKVYFVATQTGDGAIYGNVTDVNFGQNFADAADAFFPMTGDDFVVKYLSAKAEEHNLENKKESGFDIWKNWEENILRENFRKVKSADFHGNFGMHQAVLVKSAVAIGNEADSEEMLDFLYKTGGYEGYLSFSTSGGNVSNMIVADSDRDGFSFESSPQYNYFTPDGLIMIADALAPYKGRNAAKYDIINNPRFAQIAASSAGLVVSDSHTVQIGDSQGMATLDFVDNTADLLIAFKYLKDTPVAERLAKQIYFLEEGDFSELHYDIFTENPESVVDELEALVRDAEQPKSNILTGYGLALLRGGERHDAISHTGANNSLRTFWMYGGWGSSSHHQRDTLNIGIEAFGLNLSPDNGYPEATGTDPNRVQWVEATLSHNTVTVDEEIQELTLEAADPLHYDGDGRVKLIDMRSEEAYPELDEYRRTLVTVEAPGDIAYAVDFFNVQGGSSHIYSFHAQSESAQTEGLTMNPQMKDGEYSGSYAGVDVPGFKQDPGTPDSSLFYPKGFTWLKNLDRAANPEGTFVVDFAITDYNKAISNNKDIHLRMTQLPDSGADFTEVTVADGYVPNKQVNKNLPRGIKYALVKREGENLNSLFTTVLEPYRGERYIKSITPVEVTPAPANGEVKAVCVELTNCQKDYIVYSTDSSVLYNVGGMFNFQGFVGVYSVDENGNNVYSYINDGMVIGDNTGLTKEYTGAVAEFNKDYEYNNHITLNMQVDDATSLAGKTVRINNDGVQNGVYLIQSAEKLSDEKVKLNFGLVTTIRKYVDENDFTKGYVYNIKEGQTATIAIEHEEDYSPTFEKLSSSPTVSAGSSLSIPLKATTELPGVTVSYIGTSLPRGASINEDTGVLTWKPDASQIGDNHVSVTARDSAGREAVYHFVVTVYGSTTGGSGNDEDDSAGNTPSVDSGTTDVPAGGGGGGGSSGQGTADTPPDDSASDNTGTTDEADNELASGNADAGNGGSDVPQFVDLGNHTWAADSINALAATGIIKGTSASTFSPGNNITRADFALLLVRAFKLTSDNAENFADVAASDYFAPELAIARNTGIVNGIGDNKYAPRNPVTRQDMMVIVYRALQNLDNEPPLPKGRGTVEDGGGIQAPADSTASDTEQEPSPVGEGGPLAVDEALLSERYGDGDNVAPYARDTVSYLISAGLVNGKSGLIAPTDYTTRAEVAVLIKRILDYVKMEEY